MKIQTTIEFIIILAAISSLIVVALSVYNGISSDAKETFNAVLSSAVNQSNSALYNNQSQTFEISYYLNSTLPYNMSSLGYIEILSQAPIKILNVSYTTNDGYIDLDKGLKNTTVNGFSIDEFYYIPNRTGLSKIQFNFKIKYKNNTVHKNISINTSVYNILKYSKSEYTVSININNSSVTYPIENKNKIYKFNIKTHCSAMNNGVELPINEQCGNASYDLFIFSNYCFYDQNAESRVICIYKDYNNLSLLSLSNNESKLSYNGKFKFNAPNISIYSNFSSSNYRSLNFDSSGYPSGYYGKLELAGAHASSDNYSNQLLYRNGSLWRINSSSAEDFYVQKAELNSLLAFYNGTGVDGKQWEYISENINAYNESIPKSSQPFEQDNCGLSYHLNYKCKNIPIKFSNITAEIKNYNIENETVIYGNYTINLR